MGKLGAYKSTDNVLKAAGMVDAVGCSFFRKIDNDFEVIHHDVVVRTGSQARSVRLREACTHFALDHDAKLWACPDIDPTGRTGGWWVFRIERQVSVFVANAPSQAAAEMRMIHDGGA